jgi:D-alanine transaminase
MDRGFLFGDGIYEVIPVFAGKMLRLDEHLGRLQNSLNRIALRNPHSEDQWKKIFTALLDENAGEDRAIYLQITRGAYVKRDLSMPPESDIEPTVFAMVLQVVQPDIEVTSAGISVVTIDDFRWDACDIKSTSLVANVMLRHQASSAGVEDAILIKRDRVTEGTASNVFIVKDNVLITPPTSKQLLPGITRDLVIEIARNNAISVEEREIAVSELSDADEIWMTSSTREIAPVVSLDGRVVGAGEPGRMWSKLVTLYQEFKKELRRA